MSTNAGQLLVHRMHIALSPDLLANDIDTGLCQENRSYENDSVNEPVDGAPGNANSFLGPVVAPDPSVPSRVMVIPQAPYGDWAGITHGEPYFNTITKTVHVVFITPQAPIELNVLFWMPHSLAGPIQADLYNVNRQ